MGGSIGERQRARRRVGQIFVKVSGVSAGVRDVLELCHVRRVEVEQICPFLVTVGIKIDGSRYEYGQTNSEVKGKEIAHTFTKGRAGSSSVTMS